MSPVEKLLLRHHMEMACRDVWRSRSMSMDLKECDHPIPQRTLAAMINSTEVIREKIIVNISDGCPRDPFDGKLNTVLLQSIDQVSEYHSMFPERDADVPAWFAASLESLMALCFATFCDLMDGAGSSDLLVSLRAGVVVTDPFKRQERKAGTAAAGGSDSLALGYDESRRILFNT